MFGPNDAIYFNDLVFGNVDVEDACFEALVFGHWWRGFWKVSTSVVKYLTSMLKCGLDKW